MQPAVDERRFRGGVVAPVAGHDLRAAHEDLPGLTEANRRHDVDGEPAMPAAFGFSVASADGSIATRAVASVSP